MKRISIILILVAGFFAVSGVAVAGLTGQSGLTSINTLPGMNFGPFINIWLETNIDGDSPAVAHNRLHNEYLVVWHNDRGATIDVYARRVRADGTLLSYFTISHNANFWNYNPDVAYSPKHDEYLVVWTYDSVITGSDTWARRVKWDGSWMGPEFQVGRPDKSGNQVNPAVAYNEQADEYLVVYENRWGSTKDIDAQRVRASDGQVLSWANIASSPGTLRHFPDVAYSPGDDKYLIVYWYQPSSSTDPGDIFGKVVNSNMSEMSNEINICVDANDQRFPSVAGEVNEFLVVWEDNPSSSTHEIYARRIASDGIPLGPAGGFWISGTPGSGNGSPQIASGATGGYLVVWDRYMGGVDFNVHGRFVRPGIDSGFNSEFPIDNDTSKQWHPAAACDQTGDCLVVESDGNSAGGDQEIRGRLIWFTRVFLPVNLKGY